MHGLGAICLLFRFFFCFTLSTMHVADALAFAGRSSRLPCFISSLLPSQLNFFSFFETFLRSLILLKQPRAGPGTGHGPQYYCNFHVPFQELHFRAVRRFFRLLSLTFYMLRFDLLFLCYWRCILLVIFTFVLWA